ncbi:MAG: hypothetical protein M3Q18_09630, partial [Actinomycetota bacterium]|nr:hypothetical protein [Actinomycetota bacterium]
MLKLRGNAAFFSLLMIVGALAPVSALAEENPVAEQATDTATGTAEQAADTATGTAEQAADTATGTAEQA